MDKISITNESFYAIFSFIKQNYIGKAIKSITHTQTAFFIEFINESLFFSLESNMPFIGITKHIEGNKLPIEKSFVKDISLLNNDRILIFSIGNKKIIIELIPRHTNAIIIENETILWLFRNVNNSYRILKKKSPYISPPISPRPIKSSSIKGLSYKQNNGTIIIEKGEKPIIEIIKTVSELLQNRLFEIEKEKLLNKELKRLNTQLKQKNRLLRKLYKQLESASDFSIYMLYGELLKTNLHKIQRGMTEINLQDWVTQKNISIPLNPNMSPKQNMDYYFKKSKKGKKSIETLKKRIKDIENEISQLKEKLNTLSIDNISLPKTKQTKSSSNDTIPGIKYITTNGFTVAAGRNSKENEILTFSYAKNKDLFFHCRESAGSHTILFIHTAKGTPIKQDIEEAAVIAAFHSKSKHSTLVPVTYTEKKYVQKIKGIQGKVKLLREKVITIYNPEENIKRIKKYGTNKRQ